MADDTVRISELPGAGVLSGIELVPLVKDGVTSTRSVQNIVQEGGLAAHELASDPHDQYAFRVINNLVATTNPAVSNDSTEGYEVLSRWVNVSTAEIFLCLNASVGAAEWQEATLTVDDLGSAALANVGAGNGLDADLLDGLQGTDYWTEVEQANKQLREDLLKQATLTLDFANNKYEVYEGPVNSLTQMPLNEAVTFTRGSTATAINAMGKIVDVGVDDQRLVGNRKGLLLEEARTNFWNDDTSKSMVSTPYGDMDVYVLNGSNLSVSQNIQGMYCLTFIVRVEDGTEPTLTASGGDGDLVIYLNGTSSAGLYAVKESLGAGWYLIRLDNNIYPPTGSNSLARIENRSGQNTYVGMVQLERGSFPTSYIPTAGSQVTRAADSCSRVLGDEFNNDEGAISSDCTVQAGETTTRLLYVANSISSVGSFGFYVTAVGGLGFYSDLNSVVVNLNLGALLETKNIVAVSYLKNGQLILAMNGVIVHNIGFTEEVTGSRLYVGNRGGVGQSPKTKFNSVRVFPTALSEAELITLTGGT